MSCNVVVSSGSAMDSTMQHDERSCNANVAIIVAGPWEAARTQRELQYECSSGSGRAMGSSIECNNAEDVGQHDTT